MKTSNVLWLLFVVLLIAAASLIYTAISNEQKPEEVVGETEQYEVEVPATIPDDMSVQFEDVEYQAVSFNNSFEHTKPGEFSEIIVDAAGFLPDDFTIVYVRNADTKEWIPVGGQEQRADENGHIKARFMITEYGNYEVVLYKGPEEIVSPVIVVE